MEYFKNKYSEVELIKKDNWADIYVAINNETQERVQLKVLRSQSNNTEYINSITDEINQLQDLKHKNLIGVNGIYSFIENHTTYYYAETEYFRGKTLGEKMILTGHTCNESLEIIKQVAQGLNEFHYRGLSYETLSTENIFINSQDIVKIDVLSYIHQKYDELEEYENYNEFDAGIDKDIYAVGVILYQLITRDSDFKLRKLKKNIEDEEVYSMLYSLTSKKKKYRYENLNEFLLDVNEHLQYLSSGVSHKEEYINENKSEIEDDLDEYDEEDYEGNKSILIKRLCACLAVVLVAVGGIKVMGLVRNDKDKTETPIELATDQESIHEEDLQEQEEEKLDNQQVEDTYINNDLNSDTESNNDNKIEKEDSSNTTNKENTITNNNTTTEKPSNNTITEKPSDNTTTQKPSTNKPTDKPSDNTTTQKPDTNKPSTNKPDDNTTTEKPSDDTTTEKPNGDTTTQKPSDDTTTEKPSDDTTIQKPSDGHESSDSQDNSSDISQESEISEQHQEME